MSIIFRAQPRHHCGVSRGRMQGTSHAKTMLAHGNRSCDRPPAWSRGDPPLLSILDRGREHLPATCRITGPGRRRSSERHVSGPRKRRVFRRPDNSAWSDLIGTRGAVTAPRPQEDLGARRPSASTGVADLQPERDRPGCPGGTPLRREEHDGDQDGEGSEPASEPLGPEAGGRFTVRRRTSAEGRQPSGRCPRGGG